MVSELDTDEWWEGVAPAEAHRRHDGQAGAAASERAGVRRAQIIDATMRMIARDGVAAVSTRKIAREAAVNLGILHYRFGSKDDLLLAVLDATTSAMIATLIAVDGHPGGGLRVALTETFAGLCTLLDRDPALPLVRCEVLLYAGRRPAQHASALQQQRFLDALQACYRLACAQGELGPIAFDELAAAVGSSIDGLALQCRSPSGRQPACTCCAPCSPWWRHQLAHRWATMAAPLDALYACSKGRTWR
jgi:AcrR family transcriptional regulator